MWCLCVLALLPQDVSYDLKIVDSQLKDFSGWTLVDESGRSFRFDSQGTLKLELPDSSKTFEISDARRRLRFVGSWDQITTAPFTIDVSGSSLGIHLVVSGKRSQQNAWDAVAEIEVIRPDEDPTRSAAQSSDWLKEQAEILLQKTNLGGGSPIIRGMSGNRILLMLDGFRINNSIFRLGLNQYLNTIPAGQLSQIEVLSGPSGTQYGSDGLGGTVHLRSGNPLVDGTPGYTYRGFTSTADGTQIHQLAGLQRKGRWGVQGHISWSDLANLEAADPVGEQVPTGYQAWDGSLNFALDLGANRSLRFTNSLSRADEVPRTDRIQSGRDLRWDYDPQILRTHTIRYEGQHHSPIYDYVDLGLAYFVQEEGTKRISTRSPDVQEDTLTKVNTAQIAATFSKVMGSISWNYGFDAQLDGIDAAGLTIDLTDGSETSQPGKFPNDGHYQGIGLFAIGEWTLAPSHSVQLGMRQSWVAIKGTLADPVGFSELDNERFTPSLSWRGRFTDWLWTTSVTQGYRTPNLEDAFSVGFSSLGFDAPNPALGPEFVWNYEVGARWHGTRGAWEATVYHSRFKDLIERVPGSYLDATEIQGEPVFVLDNVGRAEVNGISLSGLYQLNSNLEISGDVAWTRGTQTDRNEPMTRIPPLRGNTAMNGQWRDHLLSLVATWAQRQDRLSPNDMGDTRIPEGGTPGYAAFHLRYARQLSPRIHFRAAVENLLDKLYKSHGSGIWEPGRRLTLEINARFH